MKTQPTKTEKTMTRFDKELYTKFKDELLIQRIKRTNSRSVPKIAA